MTFIKEEFLKCKNYIKEECKQAYHNFIPCIYSIKENSISWSLILTAIIIISHFSIKPIWLGCINFLLCMSMAYFTHKFSHRIENICTSIHRYHHANHNFFSQISEIILEFGVLFSVAPFFLIFKNSLFHSWIVYLIHPWILMFSVFVYSSIHNINYSIIRVNKVHSLHHVSPKYNMGPDIFDVLFGTKHPSDIGPENTNHYIPNIIISTCIVLFLQYLYKQPRYTETMFIMFHTFMALCTLFLAISSYFLYIYELEEKLDKTIERATFALKKAIINP